jgi:hypothetical protein
MSYTVRSLPNVSVIILNWNGWQDTLACVESCHRLDWPNFNIVVVDNASTDGSEELLRQNLADVVIIQSGANLGFAGGNNVGIRHALECKADYVWLLNNDAVADPQALTALVECMEKHRDVAIAGSKIFYHAEPRKIWSAGGLWEKGRLHLRQRGANQVDQGQFEELCEIDSVSGCSMLVRSTFIEKIGLMDEEYFLYWEDSEWCARFRSRGYKVLFVPSSKVWHKVSVSTRQSSFSQYYYYTRNGFSFLWENDFFLLPIFGFYNLLFGFKSMIFGNMQPLQGLMRGGFDFMMGRKGSIRL